jgi:hypothetical protein
MYPNRPLLIVDCTCRMRWKDKYMSTKFENNVSHPALGPNVLSTLSSVFEIALLFLVSIRTTFEELL